MQSVDGIRFGFDEHGGFAVVDEIRRVAEYAYPTSTSATRAKRDPEGVARKMVGEDSERAHETLDRLAPGRREERVRHIALKLAMGKIGGGA